MLAGADGLSAAKAAEPSESGPALEARIEAGDSAGGGLTLALIGQLQAAGKELPAWTEYMVTVLIDGTAIAVSGPFLTLGEAVNQANQQARHYALDPVYFRREQA
ncbi:hypothetical protein [Microvirga pakistanensis]|uniref:hypothetical protein n=1 Tax=Microvirga pakistanensis TaxID=1682650 RepID=UPI00106A729F|nr:hypothetical protein [Microvirga pakistanensis]